MTRAALDVTHVSSWFRAVGIHLQPRLWLRLPLHSLELTELFFGRSGSSPLEVVWTELLTWDDTSLEGILLRLLKPDILPRIRIFEIEAPSYLGADDTKGDPYRRVATSLLRSVLPGPESGKWSSLERFRVDGLEDDFYGLDEGEDETAYEWPAGYQAMRRALEVNGLSSLLETFPRLSSLCIRDLHPLTLGIMESAASFRTQIRSLTLGPLGNVPLHRIADNLCFMPNLEYLELSDPLPEWPPEDWGDAIDLSELRTLYIKTFDRHSLQRVIYWFVMPDADVTVVLPFRIVGGPPTASGHPRSRADFMTFFWKARQSANRFSHGLLEDVIREPIADEERVELERELSQIAEEMGAEMSGAAELDYVDEDADMDTGF